MWDWGVEDDSCVCFLDLAVKRSLAIYNVIRTNDSVAEASSDKCLSAIAG
jgi:hypothetical protein